MKAMNPLFLMLMLASGVSAQQTDDSQTQIPASQYVKSLYSGGDPRAYSEDIKMNQQSYASKRGMDYHFHDLSQKDSFVMKALNGKQKYWTKIVLLQQAMQDSNIPENSWVAWIDDDIVINDVNGKKPMMDRVIDNYGQGKSVIVAKEDIDWAYLNTGIMLVKKDQNGRDVLEKLMQMSNIAAYGKLDQTQSFHEQGALKAIVKAQPGEEEDPAIDRKTRSSVELQKYVAVIPQRDGELNFNNFRRYSHIDEGRLVKEYSHEAGENKLVPMKLVYDDSESARAKNSDAFIHHTGMKQSLRNQLIKATIMEVEDPESVQKLPILMSKMVDDEELEDIRQSINRRKRIDSKVAWEKSKRSKYPLQVVSNDAAQLTKLASDLQNEKLAVLVTPTLSDKELKTEQQETRHQKRLEAHGKKYPLQVVSGDSAQLDKLVSDLNDEKRAVLVSPVLSDEELKAEQKANREKARAAARHELAERKKEEEKKDELERLKAPEEVKLSDDMVDLNTKQLSAVSESAEQGVLGLESLSNAASMMAVKTMIGFSSAMTSFRKGQVLSYGLTSIDDVTSADAVTSIHPSSYSQTLNREVGSWHNFVQLNLLQSSQKAVDSLPGGSVKAQSITTGVFYQLNPNLVAGVMLSIGKTAFSPDQGGASGAVESVGAGPFFSYTQNNWHIDGALTYSGDSYELGYSGSGNQYQTRFSGNSLTAYLGVGYDFYPDLLSPHLTLTPMVELIQTYSTHDGHHDKSQLQQDVTVSKSSSQITTARLGMELGYLLPEQEMPVELKVRLGVQHQKSAGYKTGYEFSGVQEQLNVPGYSERSLYTGLAIQKAFSKGSLALSYSGTHSSSTNSHGLQLEFERGF